MLMLKQIDITGGFPIVVQPTRPGMRAELAANGAQWCALNATAAWCIAPDNRGDIEFTFARSADHSKFVNWLASA